MNTTLSFFSLSEKGFCREFHRVIAFAQKKFRVKPLAVSFIMNS